MTGSRSILAVMVLAALFTGGCAHYATVEYPPAVELRNIETVGIVNFEVLEGDPAISDDATHRFIATVQRAQPGTQLLELGTAQEVLAKVGGRQMDLAAIQAIGKFYGVGAVISGSIAVKTPRPQIHVASLTSIDAAMKVDASMKALLRETQKGATLWTNGASGTWTLGGITANGAKVGGGMADPTEKHAQIMAELVRITTNDFRPVFGRRRID